MILKVAKQEINIVWFKRDLRLCDHQPLSNAENMGLPTILLYIFEPILLNDPHYTERHWRFVTESLIDMNKQLTKKIVVAHDNALSVFTGIANFYVINSIFSYQETGLDNTFSRDKKLSVWAKDHSINWQESPTDGIVRPCLNRDAWDKYWHKMMREKLVVNQPDKLNIIMLKFDTSDLASDWKQPNTAMQLGGTSAAKRVLDDFFYERGKDYHKLISKPQQSRVSCSRMSAYLAWGNISLRQMYQQLLSHWNRKGWRRPLIALSSRLHWHCHFIQKFESEHWMQFEPTNKGYLTFPYRNDEQSAIYLIAWCEGNTGYPLVDACMRCLLKTGYINFRMRAMLVSFLCHHLNIDWRKGAAHLASVFLDFEPGIHYTQFQMQAGVTGINTIRIYNPTKQAQEHDQDGSFIYQWCPELSTLPTPILFEPWLITPLEEVMYDLNIGKDYPTPIVDIAISYRQASDLLWSWRERADVRNDGKRILRKHVRGQ